MIPTLATITPAIATAFYDCCIEAEFLLKLGKLEELVFVQLPNSSLPIIVCPSCASFYASLVNNHLEEAHYVSRPDWEKLRSAYLILNR